MSAFINLASYSDRSGIEVIARTNVMFLVMIIPVGIPASILTQKVLILVIMFLGPVTGPVAVFGEERSMGPSFQTFQFLRDIMVGTSSRCCPRGDRCGCRCHLQSCGSGGRSGPANCGWRRIVGLGIRPSSRLPDGGG
ncbi:hypothetical protein [Paenibacillus caseinilyticus]|nr:hypothetical protein [Paenibacillus caseinilyticus]MCZ8521454.1 hypothetical protein [Paenibacillus caseinilyticus]